MRSFVIIILMSLSFSIVGQNHYLGIKGGINSTNIKGSNNLTGSNLRRYGISCGISYEYHIKNHFIFSSDFLYFQNGYSDYILTVDGNGISIGGKGASHFNYDYLSLPLKGGYQFGKKISGFINIGIVPSYLISAKLIVPTTGKDVIFDDTDDVKKFDFAGIIETGGSLKFKERFLIFTSIAYQRSFTTLTNSNYYALSRMVHRGFILSTGIKFALKKE